MYHLYSQTSFDKQVLITLLLVAIGVDDEQAQERHRRKFGGFGSNPAMSAQATLDQHNN